MTSASDNLQVDLLIVGGNESAWAAAVQALRLDVRSIALVSDTAWLGGQFSSEGVGPIDERIVVEGNSLNFPRSGLAAEVVGAIRALNSKRYRYPMPGLSWSATDTVEPGLAASLFEEILEGETGKSSSRLYWKKNYVPVSVTVIDSTVVGSTFRSSQGGPDLTVDARLTIDATDWGDIVRLSGAASYVGPDPNERFGEPSAPMAAELDVQEMNPVTWTVTLRRTKRPRAIDRPPGYDRRRYESVVSNRAFAKASMVGGPYGYGASVFTSRRLVDTDHLPIDDSRACIQLNWSVQDYPLSQLPGHIRERLEAIAPGSSRLNIADLPPQAREVIFDDARNHSLGFLYYLQTEIDVLGADIVAVYRSFELTDEFATEDNLPPKPYIRESRRLAARRMVTGTDAKATGQWPAWVASARPDAVLGFQFHIDFHPTHRRYLGSPSETGAWLPSHTSQRNWDTHTDRCVLPAGSFVPVEMRGLLGTGKTIGVSSIVQSALRLHCQMLLVGQVAGTIAAASLARDVSPSHLVDSPDLVRQLQLTLLRGVGGPGVSIWAWQDVDPSSPSFEAISMLALLGIWPYERSDFYFRGDEAVDSALMAEALRRLEQLVLGQCPGQPRCWVRDDGDLGNAATWADLAEGLSRSPFSAPEGVSTTSTRKLLRADFARMIYEIWQRQTLAN